MSLCADLWWLHTCCCCISLWLCDLRRCQAPTWFINGYREVFRRLEAGLLWRCIKIAKIWGTARLKKQDKYIWTNNNNTHQNTYCELNPLKIKDIHICMYVSIHRFNSTLNLFHHCLTLDTEVLRFPMAARCTLVINAWSDMLILPINMFHKPVQQLLQRPSLADWH